VRRGRELVSSYLRDHIGVRHEVLDLLSPLSHMDEILAESALIRGSDIRQEALSEKEKKFKIEIEQSHNFQIEAETEMT
jgi:hypothetical protein